MLKVKPITKKFYDLKIVRELIKTSFPKNERLPFWFLLWKTRKKYVNFLAFYDENVFVGFLYLVTKDDLTFVLYIAVNNKIQSKGYGSQILNYIKILYPNNKIILNIEQIDENAANNEQRKKRRAFYLKNGYENSGIVVLEKGNIFENLIIGGNCKIKDYHALLRRFVGPFLYLFFKPKLSYSQ
ncbi:GNAT family N-acetyltransferase [Spiroplasma endosymbiont of Stenodema calcarata]|uniref:GNAT family N-acetyltransferase n=1 Tax=Spiroplasma endosymbiont of Stenodema calcarata TaxID=3139328 RepID=UPI0030E0F3BE